MIDSMEEEKEEAEEEEEEDEEEEEEEFIRIHGYYRGTQGARCYTDGASLQANSQSCSRSPPPPTRHHTRCASFPSPSPPLHTAPHAARDVCLGVRFAYTIPKL